MTDFARVAVLEAASRAALPALAEHRVRGWLLRVSGGETKRVNSANPLDPDAPVGAVLDEARRLYAAHDLPCRFRLMPLAHPDADRVLAEAGFVQMEQSWTMTAPLVQRPADPAMRLTAVADHQELAHAGLLSNRAGSALDIHVRLLAAIPGAKTFATLVDEGVPIAAGYASIGEGRAQLSDIVVAPATRGRGFGRRLVAGLLGWAHGEGCREAMLQVLDANTVARALYRSLGFVDAYPYHYRVGS